MAERGAGLFTNANIHTLPVDLSGDNGYARKERKERVGRGKKRKQSERLSLDGVDDAFINKPKIEIDFFSDPFVNFNTCTR